MEILNSHDFESYDFEKEGSLKCAFCKIWFVWEEEVKKYDVGNIMLSWKFLEKNEAS